MLPSQDTSRPNTLRRYLLPLATAAMLASTAPIAHGADPAQIATQVGSALTQWRAAVAVGTDTNCGRVIGHDGGRFIVQRPDAAKVMPVTELYPPTLVPCLLDLRAAAPAGTAMNSGAVAEAKPEGVMSCYLATLNDGKPNAMHSVRGTFGPDGKPRICAKGGSLKIGPWHQESSVMNAASKVCDMSKPLNKSGSDASLSGTTVYCVYSGAVAPDAMTEGWPIRVFPNE